MGACVPGEHVVDHDPSCPTGPISEFLTVSQRCVQDISPLGTASWDRSQEANTRRQSPDSPRISWMLAHRRGEIPIMKRKKPGRRSTVAHTRQTKGTARPSRLFPVLLFLSLVTCQSLSYGQAGRSESPSAPPEELSVGLLGFRDESGAGGQSGIRKLVDVTVRQALFDQGLGPKWIDSDTGTRPITELAADQLATIGRRRGVKFVVQGIVSAITFDDKPGEVRISVGLEAEVVSVETGVARTVTAESSAITRMADSEQVPALSSVELGNRDFANSPPGRALTRALSNAGNRLAELIYTAITAASDHAGAENVPQEDRAQDNPVTQDQEPVEGGDVFEPREAADQTEEEQAAENEEDLQQLIAQADEVVSGNANVDAAQVERLRQLLGQLLQKLEDKSRLLEAGDLESTDQIDQAIETEKADLQQAVEQTYSDENFRGEPVQEMRPASSSLLERVTEYVGLTFDVIQKIQELRSTFHQAQNDYAAMEAQPTWEQQQGQPQDPAQAEETAEPEEESLAEVNGVVTEEGGEPVEGAVITEPLSEQTATTDQFGSYTLKDVPARLSKLLVSRGGKSVAEGRINLLPGRTSIADFSLALKKLPGVTRAITGARILPSAVNLVPKIGASPGGTISGVVQDSRGRAMARTLVQLKGLSLARTDSKGRYRFTNVPTGPQFLTALKSGVKFSPQPVQIQARKTVAANIKVAEVMPVVRSNNSLIIDRKTDPLRTGALYGLVTDDKNRPVVGAKVSLSAVSKSRAVTVRTRADGRYDLRGLFPGSYRVMISRVGYNDVIRSISLDAGKKATGNFRLAEMSADSRTKLIERAVRSMGEVRGFVYDANRKGIGHATVELKRTGASTVSRIGTDGRGKYVLRAFPGSYQLNVTKQGFREASTTVVLKTREPLTKDFQLGSRAVGFKQSDGRLGGTGRVLGRTDGQGSGDSKQSRRREGDTDTRGTDRISTSGMLIEKVVPAVAAPGSTIQIYGREFGLIPGPKVVAINGHNKVNVMRIVSWSDSLVRAEIPRELRDGGYVVLIYYDDSYRTSSGSKRIKLAAETEGSTFPSKSTPNDKYPSGSLRQRSIDKGALSGDETEARDNGDRISKGGMLIEKLVPAVAGPGSTIEIHGRDFGQIPGNKVVAINAHNRLNVMKIRSWSNSLVRAQIPRDLKGGGYVVLIYYDDSYRTSSNSKTIKVPAAR